MSTITDSETRGEVYFTRQRDWFDPSQFPHSHVTIIGVGGIGSFAALALAKLGISKLTLIDFDTVEAHNIPNQLYSQHDRHEYKVDSLAAQCMTMSPCEIDAYVAELGSDGWQPVMDDNGAMACLTPPARLDGVVISAVDSMAVRELIWQQCRMNMNVPLLLDGRLDQENIVVYAADPRSFEDIRGYEATLYSDEEARETSCTRQSIIDVGFAVGSLLTRAVRRHYAGEPVDRIVYLDQANLKFYNSMEWIA